MSEKETRFTRTAKSRRLICRDSWLRHKRLNKDAPAEVHIESYPEFSKIARTILKNVAKAVVDRQGGVFMKNLGYFCVWMSPVKKAIPTKELKDGRRVSYINFDEPYVYNPHFFPHYKGYYDMKFWTMERTFHRSIKQGIRDNLRNYRNYTFHLSIIKKMFF